MVATDESSGLPLGRGQTVLVVEDDPAVQEALACCLEQLNYQVQRVANGGEALQALEAAAGGIDLVLSDVVMPHLGGEALCRQIHQRWPNLPVVLITGHARVLVDPPSIGAVACLTKPIQFNELALTLSNALAQARLQLA